MEDQVLTNSGYKKFKAIKKSIHKKYYEIKRKSQKCDRIRKKMRKKRKKKQKEQQF